MGSVRNKLPIFLAAFVVIGATGSVASAQRSGLDHYAARLGYPSSRTHTAPQDGPSNQDRRIRQTSYPQLDIPTAQPQVYRSAPRRTAQRLSKAWAQPSTNDAPIHRYERSLERSYQDRDVRIEQSARYNTSISDSTYENKATAGQPAGLVHRLKRVAARSARQLDDVFGEAQVPDAKPVEPPKAEPVPTKPQDDGGVELPPGALDELREPKLPGGDEFTPEVMPDRDLPDPDRSPQPAPRRRAPQPSTRPAPSASSSTPQRKRKKYDDWGNDEIEYQSSGSNPSLFSTADPRHPAANNGPASWYRPRPNGQPMPPAQPWPHGFSDPNVYATQPQYQTAPGQAGDYQQTIDAYAPHQATPYADSFAESYAGAPAGAYASVCQPACNGTPGYANGGCNSCGTGIVNGCQESVFYLAFFGGFVDMDAVSVADEASGEFLFELEDGYVVGGALGQYQGRNLRTEIEFSFRENDLAALTAPGDPLFAAPSIEDAGIESYSGMANVLWEFVEFPCDRIKPYVGAGFGFVNVQAQGTIAGASALGGADDSDSSFGYQWMAGLKYAVNESMDLFGEYRFLKADSLQLGGFGFDYETSNIVGGLRLNF